MAEPYSDLNAELDRLYAARFPDAERESKARLWRVICEAFFSKYVPGDAVRPRPWRRLLRLPQ